MRRRGILTGVRLRSATGTFRPYVDLGAGIRTIGANDVQVSYHCFQTGELMTYPVHFPGETKLAFAAGLGVLYAPRPSFGVFADARFDVMLTEGETTQFIPFRIGVLFR